MAAFQMSNGEMKPAVKPYTILSISLYILAIFTGNLDDNTRYIMLRWQHFQNTYLLFCLLFRVGDLFILSISLLPGILFKKKKQK